MLLLRIFSWLSIIARLCFCQHYPVTLPVVDRSSSLTFYSAPFLKSAASNPQRNVAFFPQRTVNPIFENFGIIPPPNPIAISAPTAQHLVAAPIHHHSGNCKN